MTKTPMTFLCVFLTVNEGEVHGKREETLGEAHITGCKTNHVHFCTCIGSDTVVRAIWSVKRKTWIISTIKEMSVKYCVDMN